MNHLARLTLSFALAATPVSHGAAMTSNGDDGARTRCSPNRERPGFWATGLAAVSDVSALGEATARTESGSVHAPPPHRVLSSADVNLLIEQLGMEAASAVLAFIGGDTAPDGFDPVAAVRDD